MSNLPTCVALAIFATVTSISAQCNLQIAAVANPLLLVNEAFNWDPDGPGPANPLLVCGGGATTPNGIITYDWQTGAVGTLGFGLPYEVDAFTATSSGDLVAGGGSLVFLAGNVAVWDGATWTSIGTANGYVWALLTLPNGDVIAGGDFTQIAGVAANHIARWNGSSWSPLGVGFNGRVLNLSLDTSGDLLAGGWYTMSGTAPTTGLARWNNGVWQPLLSTPALQPVAVTDFVVQSNGNVVGVGAFGGSSGTVETVASWDGTAWSPLGLGTNGPTVSALAHPNGDVFVGGQFSAAGGTAATNIARWDGTAWSPVGSGLGGNPSDQVIEIELLPNGDVMAGGFFGGSLARISTPCSAQAASIGAGCSGSGGLNVLTADTAPWIGTTTTATATGLPALALGISVTGFTTTSLPLSTVLAQGLAGCDVLVSPDVLDLVAVANGQAQTQLVIPDSVTFAGLVLHQQVVSIEVDAQFNFLAATSTNALSWTLGAF